MNEKTNDIMIVDEEILRSKIHIIRGQQVMLDSDLAEIYGYTTRKFNEQVKNNAERFEGEDFTFQLTEEEFGNLMSKNRTSSWGGRRKLPKVFTEQGIYLLMTVLKGDLAVKQSRALVRLFKSMKDYLIENQPLLTQKNYLALAGKLEEHAQEIRLIRDNMVSRSELTSFMKLFDQGVREEEILILDGEPFKADEAYQKIYFNRIHFGKMLQL